MIHKDSVPPRPSLASDERRTYWPIRDFAEVVHRSGARHKGIGVLVGYFDESGITDASSVTLVAGIVTDSVLWSRLEKPWTENLQTTRVPWFHAVDCEHGEGEFAHTSRPLRESLLNGLCGSLARVEAQGFVAAVYRDDWKYAPQAVRDRSENDPFYFCLEFALQQVSNWSKQYQNGEPVALVFANHQKYETLSLRIHQVYLRRGEIYGLEGLGSLTFAEPRLVIPLQAADLLAYEAQRYITELRKQGAAVPTRPALTKLESGKLSIYHAIHDRTSLQILKPKTPLPPT